MDTEQTHDEDNLERISANKQEILNILIQKHDTLTTQLNHLNNKIAKINEEFNLKLLDVHSQKKTLEETIYHVSELLRLEGYSLNSQSKTKENEHVSTNSNKMITDAAYSILEKVRVPLHYRDLAKKIRELNIPH